MKILDSTVTEQKIHNFVEAYFALFNWMLSGDNTISCADSGVVVGRLTGVRWDERGKPVIRVRFKSNYRSL